MTNSVRPTEEELQAYIDGELASEDAAAVENAMRSDAQLARKVQAYRADKVRLRHVYGPLVDRTLPDSWLSTINQFRINAATPPPARSRRYALGLAAAASIAVVAGAWLAFRDVAGSPEETFIAEAMQVHLGGSAAFSIPASDAVMAKTLGLSVKAPDLSRMGFSLTGMMIRNGGNGAAVALSYRDEFARTFTLYLTASPGTPRFEMIRQDDTRICIWQDDVLSSIMLADVSAAEMLRLSSLAYSGLNA
jgi:anti-sigma factor RsiW